MKELFWQFLFYSFLGFCLEVAFAQATRSPKPDRKCHLILPVCPVYGIGALAILLLPASVKENPLLLYLAGGGAATLVEWGLSLFYEKAAGAAFWDYAQLPLNVGGRVCLPFSLIWGWLALPLVYWVQPRLEDWAHTVPAAVTVLAALLYLGDAAVSLRLLRRQGTEALRWYRRLTPSEARPESPG